jgi:hypothetical protein
VASNKLEKGPLEKMKLRRIFFNKLLVLEAVKYDLEMKVKVKSWT